MLGNPIFLIFHSINIFARSKASSCFISKVQTCVLSPTFDGFDINCSVIRSQNQFKP
jgi:hypothetical protein